MGVVAVALGALAVAIWAQPPQARSDGTPDGRALFEEGCSTCHGFDGFGIPGRGPSLVGAGEAAVDFYLRTGRMPLDQVGEQPLRGEPRYDEEQILVLDAYVGSLGGNGPPIPAVHPEQGSLSDGMRLFTESCAGCHAISGKGGVAVGAYAPPLGAATPTEVGEAVRVGPYVMPSFSEAQIDPEELDSLARYVQLTQEPEDAGGFGIGHIGPVPEGLVAWFAAIAALLLIARIIGERKSEGGSQDDEGGSS
jgi:ubiquinol-cytochrome c reductase cytochrome c subunit